MFAEYTDVGDDDNTDGERTASRIYYVFIEKTNDLCLEYENAGFPMYRLSSRDKRKLSMTKFPLRVSTLTRAIRTQNSVPM